MQNRINPYQNALVRSYRHPAQPGESPARAAETARTPASGAAAPTAAAPAMEGLSRVEQQMIERYFPKSETMSLRLYGANRNAQTIHPGAVGAHLDVRG